MGTRANAITAAALNAKWRGTDRWLSDGGSRGAGRLVAKIGQSGAVFYFAYYDSKNKRRFWPIGPHDSSGTRGVPLQQARDRAAELSAMYRNGTVNLHEHFERQHDAEERAHRATLEAARREQEAAQRSTLRQLLDAYVTYLERNGKQSAGDVKRIFNKHVLEAAPDIADRRAVEIPVDDFVGLIGRVAEAEKGRTAAKLRSYLRAAYSLAIRSRTDPSAPMLLRTFGIDSNPIASIGALSKFNRARDRNLSAEELAAFLKRLEAQPPSVKRDALELSLLLGGQRPAQLLRARRVDVDLSAGTITLRDPKGARQQPRTHVLPLTKKAAAILARILEKQAQSDLPGVGLDADGKYLPPPPPTVLFTGDGATAMRPETVSQVVSEISKEMVKARKAREPFQLRDLRRTCETMLAGLGVSSDVRAQLQSHGLGGVQQRHYDRHEYMDEKRRALERWQRHLDALVADKKDEKVVPMKRRLRVPA